MRKVLSVLSSRLAHGGITSYVSALYSNAFEYEVKLTVYTSGPLVNRDLKQILESQGVLIRCGTDIPYSSGFVGAMKRHRHIKEELDQIIKSDKFDIVHIHTGWPWFAETAAKIACEAKTQKIIVHSHGTEAAELSLLGKVQQSISLRRIRSYPVLKAACSNEAGCFLFGGGMWTKEGILLQNGIDVEKYCFNEVFRTLFRSQAKCKSNTLVVGFTGRLGEEKNIDFLLDVYADLEKTIVDSQLWIVGDGECSEQLKKKATELGIENKVLFWGETCSVEKYLSGMDVFVLPSKNEAFGISVIEAEANGLPCVLSDAVPSAVDLAGTTVVHLPLEAPLEKWSTSIIGMRGLRDESAIIHVIEAGYNREISQKAVWDLYDCKKKGISLENTSIVDQ